MYLYETRIAIYFRWNFTAIHFVNVTFSKSLLFSWVALLNWYTKSSRFEFFNDDEPS